MSSRLFPDAPERGEMIALLALLGWEPMAAVSPGGRPLQETLLLNLGAEKFLRVRPATEALPRRAIRNNASYLCGREPRTWGDLSTPALSLLYVRAVRPEKGHVSAEMATQFFAQMKGVPHVQPDSSAHA